MLNAWIGKRYAGFHERRAKTSGLQYQDSVQARVYSSTNDWRARILHTGGGMARQDSYLCPVAVKSAMLDDIQGSTSSTQSRSVSPFSDRCPTAV